ncbi:MAG: hypothetical protein AB8B55_07230 [Mariniblastus sp.]
MSLEQSSINQKWTAVFDSLDVELAVIAFEGKNEEELRNIFLQYAFDS